LGYGTGRVYTITYQTVDASGNTAVGYDSVVVHHQIQKGRNMPPDIFQELPYASYSIQNHPNPFNPATTIFYSLPEKGNVRLCIYNVLGEEIRSLWNGQKQAGHHTITWDGLDNKGRTVAGGIYLCRIETSAYQKTIRMLMLK
jgi:hypothetical protein